MTAAGLFLVTIRFNRCSFSSLLIESKSDAIKTIGAKSIARVSGVRHVVGYVLITTLVNSDRSYWISLSELVIIPL